MLKELKNASISTQTENGAVTYSTTQSDCLDLFATAGALRHASDEEITKRILRACAENLDLALKTIFFARDVRGGMGERRLFRIALRYLASAHTATLEKNIEYIPEFGRYDDLLVLIGTPCESAAIALIKSRFEKDMKALEDPNAEVSLLGKWLPSINTSNANASALGKKIASALGLNAAQYRRALVALRARIKIIENYLRTRDYSFDYSKQPSKAMLKYRGAFSRNDGKRYAEYLCAVSKGEVKMNTSTLTPHDIVAPCLAKNGMPDDERRSLDVAWNALGDFVADGNALAVVDGSGSMYYNSSRPLPAAVAQSLGIYFAERAKGEYRNTFITFSENPKFVEIKGKDIYEKVRYCMSFDEVANTNIERVFALVLDTAIKHKIPQSELPSALYIISDMEFDECTDGADVTNFEAAKAAYAAAGYRLPQLVFWNVDSRGSNMPVTMNENGVILVSGGSPQIFSMLKSGNYSPYEFMIETLSSERYSKITA